MRKLIITAVVALFAVSAVAQVIEPVQTRFQQTVELKAETAVGGAGIEYTAGCRINPWLFVGAGTGFFCNFNNNDASALTVPDETSLRMHKLNIPLYVNLKTFFIKDRRWTPFVSLTAGGRLSTNSTVQLVMGEVKYSTCGLLADAAFGAEYRLSQTKSIHISIGAGTQSTPYAKNITSYGFDNVPKYKLAVNLRAGFTF